jgi:hypothetical protein
MVHHQGEDGIHRRRRERIRMRGRCDVRPIGALLNRRTELWGLRSKRGPGLHARRAEVSSIPAAARGHTCAVGPSRRKERTGERKTQNCQQQDGQEFTQYFD